MCIFSTVFKERLLKLCFKIHINVTTHYARLSVCYAHFPFFLLLHILAKLLNDVAIPIIISGI